MSMYMSDQPILMVEAQRFDETISTYGPMRLEAAERLVHELAVGEREFVRLQIRNVHFAPLTAGLGG